MASQYVVTAAHCTYEGGKMEPRDILVSVGDHDFRYTGETVLEKFIQVESIFRHPDFTAITEGNDIAILKLKTSLPLGRRGLRD